MFQIQHMSDIFMVNVVFLFKEDGEAGHVVWNRLGRQQSLSVRQRCGLRWTRRVTRMARIKDEKIRANVKATESPRKSKDRRLLWYRHISRGYDDYVERWVMDLMVDGTINREKPSKRWMNNLREYPKKKKVRRKWCVGQNKVERKVCQNIDPAWTGQDEEEEEEQQHVYDIKLWDSMLT